ncbi:MAG: DMT family transporter [Chloroflexi bacterium]|nr:DMT family transporter [Chloroflexota bacterium]
MNKLSGPEYRRALFAVIATPLFLGVAPIFGKQAILAGADPFTVAAFRTVVAVALLWIVYLLFFRRFIYIYPAGLLGCVVVGLVNGIGSLFYYGGLQFLDASMVQLINGMYLVFALLMSHIGGEPIDRRTLIRVALALGALGMLTSFGSKPIDFFGIGLMLGSALMFAGTVILSQYVLYEMPPTTATLYILTTMGVVVVMAWAAVGQPLEGEALNASLQPIFILGVTTALSRLAMFASVSIFGSLRTAIIAIGEIGVALLLAFFVLGDRLTPPQTIGVLLLAGSILLIRSDDLRPAGLNLYGLLVRDMANVQFQRIAFHRAFGRPEHDNEFGVMESLTPSEMEMIRQMMGADNKPVQPLPMIKNSVVQGTDLDAYFQSLEQTRPKRPDRDPQRGAPPPDAAES